MNRFWMFGSALMLVIPVGILADYQMSTQWFSQLLNHCAGWVWQDQDEDSKSGQTKASQDQTKHHDEDEEDADAKAEDLIKDWQKPDVAVFFSGNQKGYIEPCGCTGLDNQKGGLMRRHSVVNVLEQRGWNLLKIDSGDQVNRPGQQSLIKLEKTLEAMTQLMKYDVIGLGAGDFEVSPIDLAQSMINANQGITPFVCANVEVMAPELCLTHRIIEKNGKRIGITMVIGDEFIEPLRGIDGVTVEPAAAALSKIVRALSEKQCHVKILVVSASLENCRQLGKQFPDFDLLITTDCGGEPTLNPEQITTSRGSMPMVQVGAKSMYAGVVGFYFKPEQPQRASIRYKRIPLDARFEDSEEVKQVFINYQSELKRMWLSGRFDDIKPQAHRSGHKFVGSEACADCHGTEYEIWEDGTDGKGGPHKHATASLTDPNERSWVRRHFDPECVSCHMTGWNPQNFYPYESGYLDFKKDEHLFDNGCENCHGPGSGHIDAEQNHSDNETLLAKLRLEMRVTLEEAKQHACAECHDLDNSPDFLKEGAFEKYWPKIEH